MPLAYLTADEIIRRLGLMPHPEGGHYREVYRSTMGVEQGNPADTGARRRAAMTAIYFLLEAGDFSALHRVRSDEAWHLYAGGPLELHLIDQYGKHRVEVLGLDLAAGQQPQVVVPANMWQAARPAPGTAWALCGCTVAPGFEFADFSMPGWRELTIYFPEHAALIRQLTRE